VGAYVVLVRSFEAVAIPSLIGEEDKVFLIDEIGKMECFSDPFCKRVREIFDSDARVLATIPFRSTVPFIEGIRNRQDVLIVTVTRENRDRLPEDLSAAFQG
jgi:nucleoside-triphosphatase